jgi:hypothetical protein
VRPTDAISDIKAQLASQPKAPPVDAQRLLLKGKALADSKLLKEYNVNDGDTINLMLKPDSDWDPSTSSSVAPKVGPPDLVVDTIPAPRAIYPILNTSRGHQRIPSVVLTPSASPTKEKPVDIPLTLDTISSSPISGDELSSYHTTLAKPDFWRGLLKFLRSVFPDMNFVSLHSLHYLRSRFDDENDMSQAFEDFLCTCKGTLTAFEIAKIRDELGLIGMAGR